MTAITNYAAKSITTAITNYAAKSITTAITNYAAKNIMTAITNNAAKSIMTAITNYLHVFHYLQYPYKIAYILFIKSLHSDQYFN